MTAPTPAPAPPRPDDEPPAPSTDTQADPEGRHRPRWAALILAGLVLLVLAALLRPGGSIEADQTEHAGLLGTQFLPAITPGTGVEQRFVADADGLSQVSVRFGTFAVADRSGTVVVQLLTDDGQPVSASIIPYSRIRDATLMAVAKIPPRADSAGQTFRLRISLSADANTAVTLFAVPPTDTEPAVVRTDGKPSTLAVELHTDYGNDRFAFDQLGTALRRIGDYGPFWRRGAFVVALALGSILLLAGVALVPRRRALIMLLLFVVVKGLLWSVLIPPLLGVDEGGHVAFAQYLAIDHAIPKRGSPQNDLGPYSEELAAATRVFHQGDVAGSDRADYGDAAAEDRQAMEDAKGQDHSDGNSPGAGYTPVYYSVPALIYLATPGTLDMKIATMRLWSVALGVVAVYFAVLLGRLLFAKRESAALLLGAAVALHPMLSQQTAVLNNDAGTIAAGAACAYLAVLLTARSRSRWIPVAAGFAFGMGLLFKPLGMAFAPAIFLAWIVGRRRGARPAPWWWEALTAAAGVIGTYGVWVVFSTLFGYAGVGIQDRAGGPPRGVHSFITVLTDHGWQAVRDNWVDQFWGNFGWINTPFPSGVHKVILVACLVGAAIVLVWGIVFLWDLIQGVRGRGSLMDPVQADLAWGTAICVVIMGATMGEIYVLMYSWYVRVGDLGFIQGRYALMTVPVVLALPAAALRRLVPRLSPLVPLGVIAASMAALNVAAIGLIVERFYL